MSCILHLKQYRDANMFSQEPSQNTNNAATVDPQVPMMHYPVFYLNEY